MWKLKKQESKVKMIKTKQGIVIFQQQNIIFKLRNKSRKINCYSFCADYQAADCLDNFNTVPTSSSVFRMDLY